MNHLFSRLSLVCLVLPATAMLRADPVAGAARKDVVAELGEPTARLAAGASEVLMYPRGKVTLENDRVTLVALKTVEQYESEEARRRDDAERRLAAAAVEAEALAIRRKADAAALAQLVNEPRWATLPGEDRQDVLARFAQAHPDADMALETKLARRKLEREQADRTRLDDLAARVAAAERRADAAESRAEAAEQRAAAARDAAAHARDNAVVYVSPSVYPQSVCQHQPTRVVITTVKKPSDHDHVRKDAAKCATVVAPKVEPKVEPPRKPFEVITGPARPLKEKGAPTSP